MGARRGLLITLSYWGVGKFFRVPLEKQVPTDAGPERERVSESRCGIKMAELNEREGLGW